VPHTQFLLESGLLLTVVAVGGLFARKLNLSAIPAYILLGLLTGPFVRDSPLVEVFSVWGVVLLLFFIGLEFSLKAMLAGRRRLVSLGARDLVVNLPIGFVAGLFLGWGILGAFFFAAAFYVSSSAIVAKSFISMRRTANPEVEAALNILVFEDLAIAVLLAILTGAALGQGSIAKGVIGALSALLILAALLAGGRLARPWLERLLDIDDDDVFMLLTAAFFLLIAWVTAASGLSEAVGAFIAGAIVADTRHRARAERIFAPMQGLFAAVFFLAFGVSVELGQIANVWPAAILLALLAIATKLATGWWNARVEGMSPRVGLALGITLVPRGEFSIVLAAAAATAGFADAPALVTLFVLILALVGTVGIHYADQIGERLYPSPPPPSLEALGFRPELAAGAGPAENRPSNPIG
jgi:CPA2 family monovalent cation:H+ antiporter-2